MDDQLWFMKRMGGILSPKVMIDDLCSSEFQDQDGNRSHLLKRKEEQENGRQKCKWIERRCNMATKMITPVH